MIKAVIFDMDGVLIDSEPLWRRAEVEVFNSIGVPLTDKMCLQTAGLRIDEVVEYWYQKFPWAGTEKPDVAGLILRNVTRLIEEHGQAKAGVIKSLEFFKRKNLKLALASSTALDLIKIVIKKLEIKKYFEILHSAEFELHGKPDPAVYLHAAEKLGIAPEFCLAIEDSNNGILAAKAAKMKCLAVPESNWEELRQSGIADVVIASLGDVGEKVWKTLDV